MTILTIMGGQTQHFRIKTLTFARMFSNASSISHRHGKVRNKIGNKLKASTEMIGILGKLHRILKKIQALDS